MILSDLLGAEVFAPRWVGYVIDVRSCWTPTATDQPTPTARLYGLVVSPHARTSTLGLRASAASVAVAGCQRWSRWRHRDSFLVLWSDVPAARTGSRPTPARLRPVVAGAVPIRDDPARVEFREMAMESAGNPFDRVTLDQLRTRSSAKWRVFPADVLPLWVAEMDDRSPSRSPGGHGRLDRRRHRLPAGTALRRGAGRVRREAGAGTGSPWSVQTCPT